MEIGILIKSHTDIILINSIDFMVENSYAFDGLVGGAVVGIFIGAIKGQTTETGFLNGAGIGAVTGAIAAIQLLEPPAAIDCEPLPKVHNAICTMQYFAERYVIYVLVKCT